MSDNPRSISCSGEAEINVQPDEVSINLGVESFDKDLLKAKNENDDRIKKIIASVIKKGVDAKRIATDQVSIEPHYSSFTSSQHVNDGYTVRRSMQITLREVSKFDPVLTAAIASGANVVHGVHFTTTELRKHRDKAREMAMKAAEEKATALAKTMGMKHGKPSSITEGGGYGRSGYGFWGGGRGGSMSQNVSQNVGDGGGVEGTMAIGLVSITASVTIVFDLE